MAFDAERPLVREILLEELLPNIYDQIVKALAGRNLSPYERTSILRSFIESIRWSVTVRTREMSDRRGAWPFIDEKLPPDTLITSDRFSSKWSPKEQLVSRIEKASGLDRRLSNLCVLLIEIRMDLSLAGCARVAIDRFCSVQHHLADMPKALDWNGDRNPALRWWYDILSHVPQNAIERPSSLLSVWFGKAPQYLISFVENLELIAAIRPVVPYEIQLAPESVALERVAETAQTKAWEIISG